MDANASSVRELKFSDLYLGHPTLGNRFSDVPGAPANPLMAGPNLTADLAKLLEVCKKTQNDVALETDFKVEHDTVEYRVSVMPSVGGNVYVLRRMAKQVLTMNDLKIPEAYQARLLDESMVGLLLFSGAMKSGKTTSACALCRERLEVYGGVAVTAEDPIELPLEGEHGPGVCFQTAAPRRDGGFAEAARHIVRWGAKIILIGEIRDGAVAAEALRAGVNGHLVISTIHAESPLHAIRRLQSLAAEQFEPESANALMADGLAGIIHQRLTGDPRRLEVEGLFVKGHDGVVDTIRRGQFERLRSEMQLQMANSFAKRARPVAA